eukprot:5623878-Amphidinium_carterae.1
MQRLKFEEYGFRRKVMDIRSRLWCLHWKYEARRGEAHSAIVLEGPYHVSRCYHASASAAE